MITPQDCLNDFSPNKKRRNRRINIKERAILVFGGKCQSCDSREGINFFSKSKNLACNSNIYMKTWPNLMGELYKNARLLCIDCNKKNKTPGRS